MISAVFRRGGDISFVVEELKNVFDPEGGAFVPGKKYVPSYIALIGLTLETHLRYIKYIKKEDNIIENKITTEAINLKDVKIILPHLNGISSPNAIPGFSVKCRRNHSPKTFTSVCRFIVVLM